MSVARLDRAAGQRPTSDEPRLLPRWGRRGSAGSDGAIRIRGTACGGRVILSAGMGALHPGWTAFEADEGCRVRAEKLDECLAIYAGLMGGQPFSYDGKHYHVQPTDHLPPEPPVQNPHPPVWMAAAGATWWVESWWGVPRGPDGLAEVRRRVQAGPPGA